VFLKIYACFLKIFYPTYITKERCHFFTFFEINFKNFIFIEAKEKEAALK
jgi:hypothetical protein